MRNTTLQTVLLIVLSLLLAEAKGQGGLLSRGDKLFEAFSYTKAIACYEMAFKKDVKSIEHARRLAQSYWNIRDPKNAEKWYAIVAASSMAQPEDIYRYAELLRVSGQYADSDLWMKRYAKLKPEDSRCRLKENATQKLTELLETEGMTHKLLPVPFNTEFSEMAPFIHGDTFLFASTRTKEFGTRHLDGWNEQPFLNLFTGSISNDGTVTMITPFGKDVNTRYHESNAVISSNGNELYFTRNNIQEGRKVLSEDGVNNLQLFILKRTAQGWGKETSFPYNSPTHSIGHPALTKDGLRLFFTSDRPGGIGGKDLWVCYRDDQGAWGEPVNLGPEVNTEGDEMFPYVHENLLYFASDGHLGLGGLDLFKVTIRDNGFGVVTNLNAPVNSAADDLGICLSKGGEIGFVCSDRAGSAGSEDLYFFRMNSKPEDERKWIGRVMDVSDAKPIPYLPVRLLDMERNEIARTMTSLNGTYELPAMNDRAIISAKIPGGGIAELVSNEFEVSIYGDTEVPDIYMNSVMDLPVNAIIKDDRSNEWLEGVSVTVKDARDGTVLFLGTTNEMGITQGQIPDRRFGDDLSIEVTFEKSGYFTKTMLVDIRVLAFLEQALSGPDGAGLTPVMNGVDIAKAMNLRPIYFDFREHKIRSDAAFELDLVAQVMRLDPTIKIVLRSHTDSYGSDAYNLALSQRRAESTKEYLVQEGIAASRITAKGLGESELLNGCADGVECSEEQHQENRRTEFIITECRDCYASTPDMNGW